MTHPTIAQELHRKTLETLDSLTTQCQKGLISEAEFSAGVDAVWGCASGLVQKDLLQLVTEANHLARGADRRLTRTYVSDNPIGYGMLVMRWLPDGTKLEIIKPRESVLHVSADDQAQLQRIIEATEESWINLGFKRV